MKLKWQQAVSVILASVRPRAAHALLIKLTATGLILASVPTVYAADVNAVRLWRAPDHTRVVLDLSGSADFRSSARYGTAGSPNATIVLQRPDTLLPFGGCT